MQEHQQKKKISNLVLVSSDKAVRPTNIMGASKRLSELCFQAISDDAQNDHTKFSIVRFGNVLESSGSVIPKFKKQIVQGGPITLTHENVTRYFMTVTEAAQLVIQAGAMGKKSEIFLLDMGSSIKIKDLIYKMIDLSGLKVRNKDNLEGDLEIKITGLRPGEKLYEELLVGNNPEKTPHKKIYKTKETFLPYEDLKIHLDDLNFFLENHNVIEVKKIIHILVPLFQKNHKITDLIHKEKLNVE